MHAAVGDRVVIKGRHLGEPERDGEVIALDGPGGQPPWRVRWESDGHVSLFFPGSDATIQHLSHAHRHQTDAASAPMSGSGSVARIAPSCCWVWVSAPTLR